MEIKAFLLVFLLQGFPDTLGEYDTLYECKTAKLLYIEPQSVFFLEPDSTETKFFKCLSKKQYESLIKSVTIP